MTEFLVFLGLVFGVVLIIGTIAGMLWVVFSIVGLKEKAERRYRYHEDLSRDYWRLVDRVYKLERNANAAEFERRVSGVDRTKSPDPVASSNPIS